MRTATITASRRARHHAPAAYRDPVVSNPNDRVVQPHRIATAARPGAVLVAHRADLLLAGTGVRSGPERGRLTLFGFGALVVLVRYCARWIGRRCGVVNCPSWPLTRRFSRSAAGRHERTKNFNGTARRDRAFERNRSRMWASPGDWIAVALCRLTASIELREVQARGSAMHRERPHARLQVRTIATSAVAGAIGICTAKSLS